MPHVEVPPMQSCHHITHTGAIARVPLLNICTYIPDEVYPCQHTMNTLYVIQCGGGGAGI